MRDYPEDDDEMREALEEYAAEPWMVEALGRNPDYSSWGPGEDFMARENPAHPGSSRMFTNWAHFRRVFLVGYHPVDPTDRSGGEIAHWHFELQREATACADCNSSGLNPASRRLQDTAWEWMAALSQDEVDALHDAGRLFSMSCMSSLHEMDELVAAGRISRKEAMRRWDARDRTKDRKDSQGRVINTTVRWRDRIAAEEIPADYDHDCINRSICVRARATRLRVWGDCPYCEGRGHLFLEQKGRLALVLWIINPANGQSYGATVYRVTQAALAAVYETLLDCGHRMAGQLDFPDATSVSELLAAHPDGWPADWAGPDSLLAPDTGASSLPRSLHTWGSQVIYGAWNDMGLTFDTHNELFAVDIARNDTGGASLHAWIAYPRKGATARMTVRRITSADVPAIVEWIRSGKRRTLERFACKEQH